MYLYNISCQICSKSHTENLMDNFICALRMSIFRIYQYHKFTLYFTFEKIIPFRQITCNPNSTYIKIYELYKKLRMITFWVYNAFLMVGSCFF